MSHAPFTPAELAREFGLQRNDTEAACFYLMTHDFLSIASAGAHGPRRYALTTKGDPVKIAESLLFYDATERLRTSD